MRSGLLVLVGVLTGLLCQAVVAGSPAALTTTDYCCYKSSTYTETRVTNCTPAAGSSCTIRNRRTYSIKWWAGQNSGMILTAKGQAFVPFADGVVYICPPAFQPVRITPMSGTCGDIVNADVVDRVWAPILPSNFLNCADDSTPTAAHGSETSRDCTDPIWYDVGSCGEIIICPEGYQRNYATCRCELISPIVVDTGGDGIDLTAPNEGVQFDFNGDGLREVYSWTAAGSDDAFLVLDRNSNGAVDNGLELFGNFADQPPSDDPNGFIALAQFDRVDTGGNADGKISNSDAVFGTLRLWRDLNHDGVSQPEELMSLQGGGVTSIGLNYKESRRTDQYGNAFRFRAKVYGDGDSTVGKWAWDVFLVMDE